MTWRSRGDAHGAFHSMDPAQGADLSYDAGPGPTGGLPATARSVRSSGNTIAVMQPYFFPYAGYFRLFAAADEFIVFDTAQFPRRGRVHRCEVPGPDARPEWLTLPLVRQPRDTLIRDLSFAANAGTLMNSRLQRLPWWRDSEGPNADRMRDFLRDPGGPVIDHLEDGLRLVLSLLGMEASITRSSQVSIDPTLRGQARILALCRAAGATRYLNPPGGRDLYDADVFAAHGIELAFLDDYRGPHVHLLPALMQLPSEDLRRDIVGIGASCQVHP